MAKQAITPQVRIKEGGDRTVVFARRLNNKYWVTVKNGQTLSVNFHVLLRTRVGGQAKATDLLQGPTHTLSTSALDLQGFPVSLSPGGSTVFLVEIN